MCASVGRPKKNYPIELVQNIIYRYAKEKKTSGKISYQGVYHFSQFLFENGEIEYDIGEHYWRRGKGRELIDKSNEILLHQISSSRKSENETIVDTTDAINKFFTGKQSDKEKLIGALSMNERKLKRYIEKYNTSENKSAKANQIIVEQKETIQSLNEKISLYEEKLFQWLELSVNKNIPLYNLGTTGKTRTSYTQELLTTIFSDNPYEVFERINKLNNEEESIQKKNKTIQLAKPQEPQEPQRSVFDDMKF